MEGAPACTSPKSGISQTLFQLKASPSSTRGMAIDGKKTQAKTARVRAIASPIFVVKKLLFLKLRSTSGLPTPLMARNAPIPISTIGRV